MRQGDKQRDRQQSKPPCKRHAACLAAGSQRHDWTRPTGNSGTRRQKGCNACCAPDHPIDCHLHQRLGQQPVGLCAAALPCPVAQRAQLAPGPRAPPAGCGEGVAGVGVLEARGGAYCGQSSFVQLAAAQQTLESMWRQEQWRAGECSAGARQLCAGGMHNDGWAKGGEQVIGPGPCSLPATSKLGRISQASEQPLDRNVLSRWAVLELLHWCLPVPHP